MSDEFYVGYLDTPPGIARLLRVVVAGLLLGGALVSLGAVTGQAPFPAARFDFGDVRTFEGTLVAGPHPVLMVDRPGEAAGRSPYLLVGPGKFGAGEHTAGLTGQQVSVQGTLIYRGDQTMLEILPDSLAAIGPGDDSGGDIVAYGEQTLLGEIVDSKCFLGVMNPGNLKPHRACATRCISGGIPPLLLVRLADGTSRQLLLVGPQGEAINGDVLEYVAEPVQVTGRVERSRDMWLLRADPASIQRAQL
ncbi:MAG: hypothetical protein ACI8S6_002950 [Myxococcota bacterium]|jgi:hypothetical protein